MIKLTIKKTMPEKTPIEALADAVCNSHGVILPHCLVEETIDRLGADKVADRAINRLEAEPSEELAYTILAFIRDHRAAFDAVNEEYVMGIL